MTREPDGTRGRSGPLPPGHYWVVRDWSPLILLLAMAASGWLLFRAILAGAAADGGDVGGWPSGFGHDLTVAGLVAVACGVLIVLAFLPPAEVVAGPDASGQPRVVVDGLGEASRIWFLIALPIGGLLALLLPQAFPPVVDAIRAEPGPSWLVVPLLVVVTSASIAYLWAVVRALVHGVELTATQLVSRGYVRSRRVRRDRIADVRLGPVPIWMDFLSSVAKIAVTETVRIDLADGSEVVIGLANSGGDDPERAVEVLRAWSAGAVVDRP
ncbi:hypothetical protein ARHIZOSPH14_21120 [Agromyces rhizosphaerae]|uniref:PH domain-containing protein n=1 Tax=Agromyces rhizosphaerae TaxID=88374 RepID=A0A9W6FPV6_9MICO|nr:hypothetical protein [Agromyces rhizosphaerae]GLI27870.1 hypothetical protein ARHIZOSPH14_21120 [Agromyces rhizosphaerae]